MVKEINLTSSQRSMILELRDVESLSDRTNDRISSGKSVNSVADDAEAYFTAQALYNRADTFTDRKLDIDLGVSTLNAAVDAIEAIEELLDSMEGIVDSISTLSDTEKEAATLDFNEYGDQIAQLVEDAYYNGVNLLNSTAASLSVNFSNRSESKIDIIGYALDADSEDTTRSLFERVSYDAEQNFLGLTSFGVTVDDFVDASSTDIETIATGIDNALSQLTAVASTLGNNVSLLESRADFTDDFSETLDEGGDKLTLADLDEESANLVALQTRQELIIQALAISGDMERNVLTLLAID